MKFTSLSGNNKGLYATMKRWRIDPSSCLDTCWVDNTAVWWFRATCFRRVLISVAPDMSVLRRDALRGCAGWIGILSFRFAKQIRMSASS